MDNFVKFLADFVLNQAWFPSLKVVDLIIVDVLKVHSPEDRVTKVWRTVELQNGLALDPNTVWSFILAAIKLVNFLRVWQFKGELPVPQSIPFGW